LVCDPPTSSTPSPAGSEATVRGGLEEVVAAAKGRVLVTTFASNAARLHTLGQVARATRRRICVAGRSLERIMRVAKATGYLTDFPEPVSFEEAMTLPRRELLIVATGGQGEPRAGLGRIAAGEHKLKLTEGDTVVFSSRQIPGNELAIGRIMNQLARSDVITVTERQAHVHVSGHPARPELAAMYHWIRPEILIPVHGEARHLHEHRRFALEQGVPQEHRPGKWRGDPPGAHGTGQDRQRAVGGWCWTATSCCPPTAARSTSAAASRSTALIAVAVPLRRLRAPVGRVALAIEGVPVERTRSRSCARRASWRSRLPGGRAAMPTS
jgi:ribonuclease J